MTAVSKEYASALFELSLELEKTDAVSGAVKTVTAAFEEDPDYIDFLSCYGIPVKERVQAAGAAFEKIDGTVLSFIQLLIEQGRIGSYFEIAKDFSDLVLAYKSMTTATVYSVGELSDTQKSALVKKLSAVSGKAVTVEYVIDSTLGGGLRIEVGGQVIDGSIRHRLHQLREVINK